MSGFTYESAMCDALNSIDENISDIKDFLLRMENKPLGTVYADNKDELEHFVDALEAYIEAHKTDQCYLNVRKFYEYWKDNRINDIDTI